MSTQEIEWELVNPEGVCQPELAPLAPRPTSLEGKTVGLYWNAQVGGKQVLNQVAALLAEKVNDIKFIRYWEAMPETLTHISFELDEEFVQAVVDLKPDIVVFSQCD
ncbi:MAG: hypothetical protein HY675_12455 [Chloroflexi bacterium]|nr:hypothetical protein [Chloroflexota bacterium]